MTPTLSGLPARPAVAVTGVWDPLLPAHRQLFTTLVEHARQSDLAALAVLLHPSPAALMQGIPDLQYDDAPARIALLRAAGIDAVLRIDFTPDDLRMTPADFFTVLTAQVTVAEFWLGAWQSLGVGTNMSPEVMDDVSRRFCIPIHRLPECDIKPLGNEVRKLLAAGRLREAAAIVGRAPLRARPEAGRLRLAWPPGRYLVATVDAQDLGEPGVVGEVILKEEAPRLSGCEWPDPSAEYLAFLTGPGDAVSEPAGRRLAAPVAALV